MQTKEADENPTAGGFNSVLFTQTLLNKTPKTIQPTAAAIEVAMKCIKLLPSTIQKDVEKRINDIFVAHSQWVAADKTFTSHADDSTYIAKSAKWKSDLQAPRDVGQTLAFKCLVSSLDKVIDNCKKEQTRTAVAVQHLVRDHKRQKTISLTWKLLIQVARCVLQLVTNAKPSDIHVYQSLMETITQSKSLLFDCDWGLSLQVLQDIIRPVKLEDIEPKSNPSFIVDRLNLYGMKLIENSTDKDCPYAPPAEKPTQEVAVSNGSSTNGSETPTNATTPAPVTPGSPIDADVNNLILSIQNGNRDPSDRLGPGYLSLKFTIKNSKDELIQTKRYSDHLRSHIYKFLQNLVFEGDEDEVEGDNNKQYTHNGVLVRRNKETSATTQDTTAEAATTSQRSNPSALVSTPQQRTPNNNNAVTNVSEGNNDAASDQRNPDANPPLQDEAPVELDGSESEDEVAETALKNHLSDHLNEDQLKKVVSSIQEALIGLIEAPYDKYKALNSALEQGLALKETLLETNKSEMADEALELVNNERTVAPPILRGVIQKELKPVRERVKKMEQHRATTVVLSEAQRRKLLKAQKKRKKKQVEFEGIQGGNGEDYGNDEDDADAANSRPKKKPKNSNSHPATAAAVTQKTQQNTSKNGKRRRRKKGAEKSNGQKETHSQQPEKRSNGQQNGKRGNNNNRTKQSKGK
jgi:hypothetical protein